MMSINPVGVTPIGTPFCSGFVRMLGNIRHPRRWLFAVHAGVPTGVSVTQLPK